MSGLVVLAIAGLLMQETAPHPATRAAYQPPVIRPFEPGPDFGRERAQGDADSDLYRRPLETPVVVEAYARSYEYAPGDVEIAYEQGVASAEIRADQAAGPLDGSWQIVDAGGRTLFGLVVSDTGVGAVEGGWRSSAGWGAAILDGMSLRLEGSGTLTLERTGLGWRGQLTVDGQTQPVSLVRPN